MSPTKRKAQDSKNNIKKKRKILKKKILNVKCQKGHNHQFIEYLPTNWWCKLKLVDDSPHHNRYCKIDINRYRNNIKHGVQKVYLDGNLFKQFVYSKGKLVKYHILDEKSGHITLKVNCKTGVQEFLDEDGSCCGYYIVHSDGTHTTVPIRKSSRNKK
jgi:hypothetical protein